MSQSDANNVPGIGQRLPTPVGQLRDVGNRFASWRRTFGLRQIGEFGKKIGQLAVSFPDAEVAGVKSCQPTLR